MAIGFIIMQIGNRDLDRVCAEAIAPAIEACGLAESAPAASPSPSGSPAQER